MICPLAKAPEKVTLLPVLTPLKSRFATLTFPAAVGNSMLNSSDAVLYKYKPSDFPTLKLA